MLMGAIIGGGGTNVRSRAEQLRLLVCGVCRAERRQIVTSMTHKSAAAAAAAAPAAAAAAPAAVAAAGCSSVRLEFARRRLR